MTTSRNSDRHPRAFAIAGLIALLFICRPATESLVAQSPSPSPDQRRFDIASVKPALSLDERIAQAARAGGPLPTVYDMRTLPGGRFIATMVTLKMLIGRAFDVKDYQIEGGPKWLTTDYFDIAAISGSDSTPAAVGVMLRALLVERFALRARSETRQAPVHVLTVARSDGRLGPGLERTTPECERRFEERKNGTAPAPAPLPRGLPTTVTCGGTMISVRPTGGLMVHFGGTEVERLISLISEAVAAPVIDRTGLSGHFDITLEYMTERQLSTPRPSGLDPNSNDTPPPPIATALQQQLGLKLEKQTGPLPILVIDAVDHPTPD